MNQILALLLSVLVLSQAHGQSTCGALFPASLQELGLSQATLEYWRHSDGPLSETASLIEKFLAFLRTRPDSFFTHLALFAALDDETPFEEIFDDPELRSEFLILAEPQDREALIRRAAQVFWFQQSLAADGTPDSDALLEPYFLGLLARLMINLPAPESMKKVADKPLNDKRFMILKAAIAHYKNRPSLSRLFVESNTYAHKVLLSLASAAEKPGNLPSKLPRTFVTLSLNAHRLSHLDKQHVLQMVEPFLREIEYDFDVATLVHTLSEHYATYLLAQFDDVGTTLTLKQVLSELDGVVDDEVRLFLQTMIASDLLGHPVLGAEQMAIHLKRALEDLMQLADERTHSAFH